MSTEIPPTAGLPLLWRDFFSLTDQFPQKLANLLNIPQPILTCSGTAALIIAIQTLQKYSPQRYKVIVPAYTCPLVALAAALCPPVRMLVCDLQAGSFELDTEQLEKLCQQNPLAVVVTHLAGQIADVARIRHITEKYGVAIIEDAAQAMGARDQGQSIGLQGDIAFFSLAFGKGLTSAEGGVLFSQDAVLHKALAQQSHQVLEFNWHWELRRSIELLGYKLFYRPDRLYWVYGRQLRRKIKHENYVAAVGDDFDIADIPLHSLGQWRQSVAHHALARIDDFWDKTRQQALARMQILAKFPFLSVIHSNTDKRSPVWPMLLVYCEHEHIRDQLLTTLWTSGLGVSRLFIHALPHYPSVLPFLEEHGPLAQAEKFARQTFSISNSLSLSDESFDKIIQCIDHLSI